MSPIIISHPFDEFTTPSLACSEKTSPPRPHQILSPPGILVSMDTLSGSVERVTFYNSENGYTVLRLRPESSRQQRIPGLSFDGLATVIGNLPEVTTVRANYQNHIWATN